MRKILIALFLLLAAFASFLWYGAGPAVSPSEFPPSGIVKYFEPSWENEGEAPPREIKAITYNIGYASGDKNNLAVRLSRAEVDANLGSMAATFREMKPDLLFLQEVDFQASRTFQINQMDYLAKALKMPYGAYVVTWNKRYLPWPYWPPQTQFGRIVSGQAILSRFPIEKHEVLKFQKPTSNAFWYNWFYLDRILQKVALRFGGQEVFVWNVHLEAYDPKTRLDQAEGLSKWVGEEKIPFRIVGGDFNSVSKLRTDLTEEQKKEVEDGGESLKRFTEITGLQNAEGDKDFFTMPSWEAFKKIDHIFYDPKGFRLNSVGTLRALKASDHLPVWGVFEVKRNIGDRI